MKRNAFLLSLLFGVWLLWSGIFQPFLLTLGVLSCVAVFYLSRQAGLLDREGAPLHLAWGLLQYLPWLAWQIVLSNIDVAKAIFRGRSAINPQWVICNSGQESDVGFVIYANSITLTPGTVTVDIHNRGLLLHALTDAAAAGILSGEMNRRVNLVEAET
jgi:multicomponent Na+:H+ antiporter subunit E